MIDEELARAITTAVAAGVSARSEVLLEPCQVGGNNRVVFVKAQDMRVVAKKYFSGADDPRDRFGAEVAFLRYAKLVNIDCVPRLLYADVENRVALLESVDGRRLQPGEVAHTHVGEALAFFSALNRPEYAGAARSLPVASEACFSIREHLELVERRVARLSEIPADAENGAVGAWVSRVLVPHWKHVERAAVADVERFNVPFDLRLEESRRCISPSDFGFHNALVCPCGRVCFLDFEYAGWDDPAKTASDFFCQPAVSVPLEYRDEFFETIFDEHRGGEAAAARARILFPVYQIKWICIVLNDFVPDLARRRAFADPAADASARHRVQFEKAQRLFEQIN